VLTIDLDRFGVGEADRVLDLGCGGGRHTFAALRRGAQVVALDLDATELAGVATLVAAMQLEGEVPAGGAGSAVRGDALHLPFPDGAFDRVVASEVLEHLPDDAGALAELVRVLRPGGRLAVTVPRWWPEVVCWALSDAYHQVEGGHVRIYRGGDLRRRAERAGLRYVGGHHAHALHSPYWWLKCAVGVDRDDQPLVRAYHRLLVWDIVRRPWLTRTAERLLDPVLGKSAVLYFDKPVDGA
jgi:SAM-dependent methyltransferase